MANVTNQTSLGVRCVGGGCTDIYKQVPGTTLSKIIRLKALHLKWCMFLTDRRLPVEPTHTHTHSYTHKGCFKCNRRSPTWSSIWPHFSCCELNIRAAEGHSRVSITATPRYEARCRFHTCRGSAANERSRCRRAPFDAAGRRHSFLSSLFSNRSSCSSDEGASIFHLYLFLYKAALIQVWGYLTATAHIYDLQMTTRAAD